MFHADFPLQFEAGFHARPQGHLSDLAEKYGITMDGKSIHPSNPEMGEYGAPYSPPDRVVRLAADTGDPDLDKALVQYGKATIQAGDGPFRQKYPRFPAHPDAVKGAVGALQQNPDWAPYLQVDAGGEADRAAVGKTVANQMAKGQAYKALAGIDPSTGRPYFYAEGTRLIDKQGHEWVTDTGDTKCPQCGQHGESSMSKSFHDRNVYDGEKWVDRNAKTTDACPDCGAKMSQYDSHCPSCGSGNNGNEVPDPDAQPGGHDNPREDYGDWQEKTAMPLQQFQQERGDFGGSPAGPTGEALCPNCGTLNQPGAAKCMKCGAKIGLTEPSHSGGPSNAFSSPFTGNPPVASSVRSEMSKWHLADIGVGGPVQQQPDTQDGPFNDHRDVSEMSHEQSVGHERLVNIVVDEMNKALTQGGAIDATLVQNLVQWLVDKFGQDADSAQAIVDAASKQAETSDGRLDNTPVVPDPAEQAIQPAQGDVVTDPSQGGQNNGAFVSHVRTPSGRVGHVVERWEDMYSEKWAMVEASDGHKESVYEDELTDVDAPEPENAVKELHDFIESLEPVEGSVASVKARIANLRIVKQEIRRHMKNPRLAMEEKLALDQIDADASVDMLALTDAVTAMSTKEEMYLASQPKFALTMSDDVQPTMYGVEHLAIEDAPDPEWTSEALEAFLPEEAEVFASELDPAVRANEDALVAQASTHVDGMTFGHSNDIRAHHRTRFVAAVKSVAVDYTTVDEPDTTDDGRDWDGPAEGIFS